MHKISVVIHTYNNEDIIRACLEAVKGFDEIVICDMYSTDKTLEIAAEYNAKIVMHENIGWADPARNFAISHATYDWVLVVDSDEIIPADLKDWLYTFLENSGEYKAVRIPRFDFYWDKPMEMFYARGITRFFDKNFSTWPPHVHSMPVLSEGKEYKIDHKHRNLAIIHKHKTKMSATINIYNKYTDFEVEKLIEADKKINLFSGLWKSFWLIFEKYFFKKGYKDGTQGVIMSVMAGIYKFFVYVKYWEYLTFEKQKTKNQCE